MGKLKLAMVVVAALVCAGCNYLNTPRDSNGRIQSYTSGANFGNSGATSCGTRQLVDGGVPWCPYPEDGDGF